MKDPVHLLDAQDPSRYTADRSYNIATSPPTGTNGRPSPGAPAAEGTAGSSSTSPVRISTKYHVNFGDTIKLVGSHEALGAWDPTQALGMTWSEGDVWTAVAQLPAGQHEFKVRSTCLGQHYQQQLVTCCERGRAGTSKQDWQSSQALANSRSAVVLAA
jgi:hypothetical protein